MVIRTENYFDGIEVYQVVNVGRTPIKQNCYGLLFETQKDCGLKIEAFINKEGHLPESLPSWLTAA